MGDREDKGELLPEISGSSDAPAAGQSDVTPCIEGYRIVRRLGQGGMGTVWEAVQLSAHRTVALKILSAGRFATDRARLRFEREVDLAANLEHPNIARVYESGLNRGVYYYAMEYVKGVPLDDYVTAHALSRDEVLELMRTVAEAVQHAHQGGVIHRDLKPSNILVTKDGQPHLLDFGLAKPLQSGETDLEMSSEGEATGTPAYMSPEQAAGRRSRVDTRSDVYSLGVILYKLLIDCLPHDISGSFHEVLRRIALEEVRRPRELKKGIDRELEAILFKALARDPEKRYATASDLAADIANYLQGEPLKAWTPTTFYFVRKRLQKHRVPVTIGLLVLLALVGAAAYWYVSIARERVKALFAEIEAKQELHKAEIAEKRAMDEAERADAESRKSAAAEMEARKAEGEARREAETSRRALYVNSIALAETARRNGDTARALAQLGSCPRDLRGWEWHYLRRICDQSILTLRGHEGAVLAVAYGPDGRQIASASSNYTVRIWDAETGDLLKTLRTAASQQRSTPCLAWSPDGRLIVIGGGSSTVIRVWDVATGEQVVELKGGERIAGVAFSPDGKWLVSGNETGNATVWNARTWKRFKVLDQPGPVHPVNFGATDGRMATVGNSIKLWDTRTFSEIRTLPCQDVTWPVAIRPDGLGTVSTRLGTDSVYLWNIQSGDPPMAFQGHYGAVFALAYSPRTEAPHTFASGGHDGMLRIWREDQNTAILTLNGHLGEVQCVAYRPDGLRVVSGSFDGTAKVWCTTEESGHCTLTAPKATRLAFSPDGRRIAVTGHNAGLGVIDLQTGIVQEFFPKTCGLAVAFTPDGSKIAVSVHGDLLQDDGTIRIFDSDSAAELLTLVGDKRNVAYALAFSPDGTRLVSAGSGGLVRVWDAASGSELKTIRCRAHLAGVSFHPDGRRIVSKGADHVVRVWDVETGDELLSMDVKPEHGPDTMDSMEFSPVLYCPDGQRIISGDVDGVVRVWDATTGERLMALRGHRGMVYSVTCSPDGGRILSAGGARGNYRLILWDATTGVEVLTLNPGAFQLRSAAFSPNGRQIAACSGSVVYLWDSSPWDDAVERPQVEPERTRPRTFEIPEHVPGGDHRETLAVLRDIALYLDGQGRYPESEQVYLRELETLRRVCGDRDAATLNCMMSLANALWEQGKSDEFEPLCREAVEAACIEAKENPKASSDVKTMAKLLTGTRKWEARERFLRMAVEVRQRILGEEHPDTLSTMYDFAFALHSQGKLPEAQRLFGQVLETQRRVLGMEHPDTLDSITNLAGLLSQQGKYAEAEHFFRQVFETQQRARGKEDFRTLESMNGLGVVLEEQGRFAESEQVLREVLEIRQRVLGKEDRHTLRSTCNLAGTLRDWGKYAEAEQLYREVLEIRQRTLGKEHPDTLGVMHQLGFVLARQGKFAESEQLLREVLEVRQRVLGKEHPDTLKFAYELSVSLYSRGKLAEAEELLRQLLEIQQRVQGKEHRDTLESMKGLWIVLLDEKKYTEAEQLARQVLETRRRLLGDEHRDTLDSVQGLAQVLVEEKNYREAEQLAREALETQQRVLGKEHRDTLRAMNTLGLALLKQEEFPESERLFREAWQTATRVLGKDAPLTVNLMHNLAHPLDGLGQQVEAEQLFRESLEAQRRVLGKENQTTLKSMDCLADYLERRGQLTEAKQLRAEKEEILRVRQ